MPVYTEQGMGGGSDSGISTWNKTGGGKMGKMAELWEGLTDYGDIHGAASLIEWDSQEGSWRESWREPGGGGVENRQEVMDNKIFLNNYGGGMHGMSLLTTYKQTFHTTGVCGKD